jgi:hypothetical protein
VPLAWAARVAGHEVLVASTAEMIEVGARSGLAMYDVLPDRDVWDELLRAMATRDVGNAPGVSEEFRDGARAGSRSGCSPSPWRRAPSPPAGTSAPSW